MAKWQEHYGKSEALLEGAKGITHLFQDGVHERALGLTRGGAFPLPRGDLSAPAASGLGRHFEPGPRVGNALNPALWAGLRESPAPKGALLEIL